MDQKIARAVSTSMALQLCSLRVSRRECGAFSGIGTGCGDPFDIGPSGDEADDVLPLLSFRKPGEENMTHRLPLRCADRRQLNYGFVQKRIDKTAGVFGARRGALNLNKIGYAKMVDVEAQRGAEF